jgi:hypothetical protein
MGIIVTKLRRAEHGELEARITVNGGETVPVTRRYGSWMIESDAGVRELLPEVAAELQRRARPAFDRPRERERIRNEQERAKERRNGG